MAAAAAAAAAVPRPPLLTVVGGVAAAVSGFTCAALTAPSPFVRPVQLAFWQRRRERRGGAPPPPTEPAPATQRAWHAIEPHDSVAVLAHHPERRAYLLARQLRPAVLLAAQRRAQRLHEYHAGAPPAPSLDSLAAAGGGITYELCGGLLCDQRGASAPEQVALDELAEELGFRLPGTHALQRMFEFPEAVGVFGARLTVYSATVTEAMRAGGGDGGGGLEGEGEAIEVVALPDDAASVAAFLGDAALVKSTDLQHALLLHLQLRRAAAAAAAGAV